MSGVRSLVDSSKATDRRQRNFDVRLKSETEFLVHDNSILHNYIYIRFNQPQLGSVHRARATSHAARAMYWRIFTKEQALYLTVSSFHSLHEIADSLPHGIAKWSCATI